MGLHAAPYIREIARFLRNVTYLHLVPQFIRSADAIQGKTMEDNPFGQGFLERIASVHPSIRRCHLKKIEHALKTAVPQFEKLEFIRDNTGCPHLRARYCHWRSDEGWQQEDRFSEGTLLNPKEFLVSLARRSLKKTLREALVPAQGVIRLVGDEYNTCLIEFVRNHSDLEHAATVSPSLKRTLDWLSQERNAGTDS